jgi:hypothetical protein
MSKISHKALLEGSCLDRVKLLLLLDGVVDVVVELGGIFLDEDGDWAG